MKILILNGSPRLKGNTSFALSAIADGIRKNTTHEVELVNVARLKVAGCVACDACAKNGGDCIMKDDTKSIIDKVYAADFVIFGSPVYYFGISAQLKAVLDKFHSKSVQFKKQRKKLGVVAVGADPLTEKQYALINEHFDCVCDYLGWEKVFGLSYSAAEPGELQKSPSAERELADVWKML